MNACSVKTYSRYQTLKEMSGISEQELDGYISDFYNQYQRFPELDEIPRANSSNYLQEKIKAKNGFAKINDILSYTETSSIQDANIKINNQYRDLETEIIPLNETAIVDITRRPSQYYINEHSQKIEITEPTREKSKAVLSAMLEKLSNLYGIRLIEIDNDILERDFKDKLEDLNSVSAFIYNGNIYINTDRADIDAPIHEMMHIFLGGIRFQSPELYASIVGSITQLPNYQLLSKQYKNRTQLDIQEEIFVDQFSKYLSNQNSFIPTLDENTIDEIFYNVSRILDSSLMGKYSVKSLSIKTLYNMSINDLSYVVESGITTPIYGGSIYDSKTNRQLANMKEKMLKNNDLIENCD